MKNGTKKTAVVRESKVYGLIAPPARRLDEVQIPDRLDRNDPEGHCTDGELKLIPAWTWPEFPRLNEPININVWQEEDLDHAPAGAPAAEE